MLTEDIQRVKELSAKALAPTSNLMSYYSPSVLAAALRGYDSNSYYSLRMRVKKLKSELALISAISELQNEALELGY